MHTTTTAPRALTTALGFLFALALPATARAHGDHAGADPRGIHLHVGTDHDSCYFDLHPELTAEEFREFAAQGGQVVRFRQVSGANTLGAGTFEVALGYGYVFIDDSRGSWNNTMSHPQSDHYLGQQLALPYLVLRLGLSDNVDGELQGSVNPASNYGFFGAATKVRLLRQDRGGPVSIALRPSVSGLVGPSEVQAWNLSTDLSISRSFHGLEPFLGAGLSSTLAVNASPDSDVPDQVAIRPTVFAGVNYNWRFLTAGAQAEFSDLLSLDFRLGGRF